MCTWFLFICHSKVSHPVLSDAAHGDYESFKKTANDNVYNKYKKICVFDKYKKIIYDNDFF